MTRVSISQGLPLLCDLAYRKLVENNLHTELILQEQNNKKATEIITMIMYQALCWLPSINYLISSL